MRNRESADDWCPCQSVPWLGFIVKTEWAPVGLMESKTQKGLDKFPYFIGQSFGASLSERLVVRSVPFLNFVQLLAPRGFRNQGSVWRAGNVLENGVLRRSL